MLSLLAALVSSTAPATVDAIEVDALEIIAVVDNYYDCFQPDASCAVRHSLAHVTGFDSIRLQAEMGLAYLVRATVKGTVHTVLFDFGLSSSVYENNLSRLGLDVADAEALVLSHAHEDHYAGLAWTASRSRAKIYVGDAEAFLPRQFQSPKSTWDMGTLAREPLDTPKGRVVEVSAATVIADSAVLSGKIPQRTPFEKVPPFLRVKKKGSWVQDTMSHELAVAFKVRGKGLVVLTSCAHSGVVNTVEHFRNVMREPRVLAIVGGMHLTSASDGVVVATVSALTAMSPTWVAPMHCTGDRAARLLQSKMPGAYVHPSVGTRYVFAADAVDAGK